MEQTKAEMVEKAQAIRQVAQHKGCKILEVHWGKLLERKRADQVSAIHKGDFNNTLIMQGFIDGVEYLMNEINITSRVSKERENPNY